MTDVKWGEPLQNLRFALREPSNALEAGGTIALPLLCENLGPTPIWLFGFKDGYPRSLRVSPPKPDRPYIRVSWGDVNVLHPPDAFLRVMPNETVSTLLDLSFAFDRRGAGSWPIAFAYEPVRAAAGLRAFATPTPIQTGLAHLMVSRARSLREAGVDDRIEAELDSMLLRNDPETVNRLKQLGQAGALFAARRFARVLMPGADSILGWKALDALELLGLHGLEAIRITHDELPHASTALEFARDWLEFRLRKDPSPEHLPFVTMLEQLVHQPDRRGNFVLTWTPLDSPIHGSTRVEIFGNGDRIVTHRPAGEAVPSTCRTRIPEMQMQALLEALAWSGIWLNGPLRTQGLPDEPKPALEIQLAIGMPFTRRIAMWNGEWRHGPAFRLAALFDRLTAEVRA